MADIALDWNKLPEQLRYVVPAAIKYGALKWDERIFNFLQNEMTPPERLELIELGRKMAIDFAAFEKWLDDFPMTVHPEAALVYFTTYLLAMGRDISVL